MLHNFTNHFTKWKIFLQNNTNHYCNSTENGKDKPYVFITKFLYSLFHNYKI